MAAELGELVWFSLAAKLADSLETVFIPAGLPGRDTALQKTVVLNRKNATGRK